MKNYKQATTMIASLTVTLLLSVALCDSLADYPTELSHRCNDYMTESEHVHQSLHMFPGLMTKLNITKLYDFHDQLAVIFSSNNATSFAVKYNPHNNYPDIALYGKEASNSITCVKSRDNVYVLNITLYYCPPGFIHTSTHGTCDCPIKVTNPEVVCNQVQYVSSVLVGFCTSRENGESKLLTARCAFANHLVRPLLPIEQNNRTGETTFCQTYSRKGKLCSECMKDTAISVFSDTYDCIYCRKFHISNLIKYLAIELIPTTVFFLAILFFHIGITSGAANGFIFFAQMITTPLEVLFLTYGFKLFVPDNNFFASKMADLIIGPYCIWNLNFFRIFHLKICLHPGLKVVHVLALRYISAIYPLLLLMITYALIELQARNIPIVTHFWRLCCFTCVRWRRVWKAKTSVIDAFASCILLSYTKFVLVSSTYLSPSDVHDNSGVCVDRVLSFDTSVPFLGREHRPFVIIAIIVLFTFGTFPPIILTLYQFKPFQNCLQCLRLSGVGFKRFVEAFQGCYRDGTDGKIDCRFFAGLYFIFRCIILVTMAVSQSFPEGFTIIIVMSALFFLLFAIFQPYKEPLYNAVDSVIIFLFAVVSTLQMYIYNQLQQTLKISRVFLLYYILLAVPLAYMTVYVSIWLYRHWKQRHNQLHTPVAQDPDFFREAALDEGETGVRFSAKNTHTHTEVVISRDEGQRGDPEKRHANCSRRSEEEGDYEVVKQKSCSERDGLLHQELEPVMLYGSLKS